MLELRNPVKDKLARGETVVSMILRSSRGPEVVDIARVAGFDACYVDLEHSPLSLETASHLCAWARLAGLVPMIRVDSSNAASIGCALDAGAMGVIIPHVEDLATAIMATRSARYAPEGTRSWSSGQPLLRYETVAAGEAKAALNHATLVALMVESLNGLEIVEDLAAIPGVDLLFIGVGDLLDDMGIPGQLRHPRLQTAIRSVMDAAGLHGVSVGIGGMAQDPQALRAWLNRGVGFLSLGTDTAFLLNGACAAVKSVTDPQAVRRP